MIRDADQALKVLREGPRDLLDTFEVDRLKEAVDFLILTDPRFMVHAIQGLAIYVGKLADTVNELERKQQ